jgi:cytochrome P450
MTILQVIFETLRLRPPIFVVPSRRLFKDTVVGMHACTWDVMVVPCTLNYAMLVSCRQGLKCPVG